MNDLVIRRVDEVDDVIGEFLNKEFSEYGKKNEVALNYDEFCFVAEGADGELEGVITGRAYYNEVHIGDLIVAEKCRGTGLGSKLVTTVEEYYENKGYNIVTLTTFGFQAPLFYQKLGFTIEFVRENEDKKLSKYFLMKRIG